jgi:hypothetical protein
VVGDIMTTVVTEVADRLDMIENTYLTKNTSTKSHPSFSTDEVELNPFDGKRPTANQLRDQKKRLGRKPKKGEKDYGWDLLGMYMDVLTKGGSPFKRSSPCLVHPDELEGALGGCPTKSNDEFPHPKLMNLTGSPCTPFPAVGGGQQLRHAVSKPFAVYLSHLKETKPEWGGHECTPAFPVKVFEHYLGGDYNIWTILVAPTTFGFPVGGERRVTLFAKKCYAPVHNMSDIVVLARSVNMSGDEYMIAKPEAVNEHRMRMARAQCVGPATRWLDLLAPGQVKCLGDARATPRYEKLREEHDMQLMVNPDQKPRFSMFGYTLPRHVRNNVLWSERHSRLMLPLEELLSMHAPCCEEVSGLAGVSPPLSQYEASDVPLADFGWLPGNGMHAGMIGIVFMYFLSNLTKLPEPVSRETQEIDLVKQLARKRLAFLKKQGAVVDTRLVHKRASTDSHAADSQSGSPGVTLAASAARGKRGGRGGRGGRVSGQRGRGRGRSPSSIASPASDGADKGGDSDGDSGGDGHGKEASPKPTRGRDGTRRGKDRSASAGRKRAKKERPPKRVRAASPKERRSMKRRRRW